MKKNYKIYFKIFLFFLIISLSSALYIKYPAILATFAEQRSFSKAHLKIKKIKINGETITYAEGGNGPTLLFIHGFQGNKHYWIKYITPFISSYHIVIPDLPAHGGSSCSKDQKFDLKSICYVINDFVNEKNIDNFQLIGTSMGGGISMKYAALFPEKVKRLILLNPVGIKPTDEKEYLALVQKNQRLFFPTTIKELDELNISLRGSPLPFNNRFKKYVLNKIKAKKEIYQRAYQELVHGETVNEDLSKIKAPTLILSGKFDKISSPNDGEIYRKNIPNCSFIVFEDGYHIFKGEAFEKALKEMELFIKK